jgi:DNA-binding response OmpR family regulator
MAKIMLVEDDKSLREIYGVRLLAEGYEIISAGDGEEALAMAVKEHPDLIVSDVMMPKISGFDMLDILRATPETKNIKIIMMTALSSEDQRTRGESLGANRYLVKSQVGIEDVVRAVHEVLTEDKSPVPPPPTPEISDLSANIVPQPVANSMPNTQPLAQQATLTAPTNPPMPVPQPMTTTPLSVAETQLPQPTAPFSTAAPSSLINSAINNKQVTNIPIQQAAPSIATNIDMVAHTNQESSNTPNIPSAIN